MISEGTGDGWVQLTCRNCGKKAEVKKGSKLDEQQLCGECYKIYEKQLPSEEAKKTKTGEKKVKRASDFASKHPLIVALSQAVIQAVIMLAALFSVFGSVLGIFISPLSAWFPRLVFVPYLIIFVLLFIGAYAWTKKFGLKWGIICCIFAVVFIGIAIPLATEVFPWLLSGGAGGDLFSKTFGVIDWSCLSTNLLNPMGLPQCWSPYESTGGAPAYTGTKTYELLKIYLGNEKPPMSGKYEVPTAYAYPKDASQSDIEEYELPFYIENLAKEEGENKGVTLENVHVDHVYAYKNAKELNYDPLFEFHDIDVCSVAYPCNLKPGEQKKKIYASKFDEVYNGTDMVDVQSRIPCEIKDLNRLQFEVEAVYNQIATHERTFIVARSSEDEQVIYKDPNLKDSLNIRAPSDGPLDVLIDFNENPYALGDRPVDQIRMSVWVSNEKVRGLYKPSSLVVHTAGEFPDWLEAEGTGCSLNGGAIVFDVSTSGFISGKTKEYKCTLKISGYPADNAYQKVIFNGILSYTYKSIPDFSSSEYLAKVDRGECPTK